MVMQGKFQLISITAGLKVAYNYGKVLLFMHSRVRNIVNIADRVIKSNQTIIS